jgi:hypothetical protein
MPARKFALTPGGPQRLTITWKLFWKDVRVLLDGNVILEFANQKELQSGASTTLVDGTVLHVKLNQAFGNVDLAVTQDGKPLPGSSTDPAALLNTAVGLLCLIAGFNLLLGLISLVAQNVFLRRLGAGPHWLVMAAIFGTLAFFSARRSRLALGLAIGLYALDGILGIALSGSPMPGAVVVRVFFIIAMVRGFRALKELD